MFNPKYTISDAISIALSEIERLTARLAHAVIPTEVLEHIKKQCQVALTHFSTHIEGNKLSMEQVSGVVEAHKTYGLLRDEKEVKNYFQLLEKTPSFMRKYGKQVSDKLIWDCHSQIMKGIVEKGFLGKFRSIQNAIYDSGTGKLVYLPPEPKEVQSLMHDLYRWVRDAKVHPIILAGIFHNQFVTIHPFVDGNGRSARFLSLYLLDTQGYDWKQLVPIDRYYADDKSAYYQMLQQHYSHNYYYGRHNTDFTQWIDYYVTGIKMILEGTINQIDLYNSQAILINNRQSKILTYLHHHKSITAAQYAARFNISPRMATRDLKQLLDWGNISVVGKARATRYFLK